VGAAVICEGRRLEIALWLLVVLVLSDVYKWSINPYPVYSHTFKYVT
jgi:hypothetical protein